MNFRTSIPISKSDFQINYDSKIVALGSCFAVNMAEKFDYFKFQNTANPVGILFHPMAIEKFIGFSAEQNAFTEKDIFLHNERWHCFDVHSDLSDSDPEKLLQNLNSKVLETNQQLAAASHLILTFGTAWVYRNIESDEIVANCHKVPQKKFKKELLSVAEIQKSIQNILQLLRKINPSIVVIFTISPVRHIKDGFIENQWSKSNQISALHETLQNAANAHYFPSYEIMMDELRDYRFYAEDMIHPNKTAIDYIWKRFSETWISEKALPMMEQIDSIQKSLRHRPFHPDSESHKALLSKLHNQVLLLQSQFPHFQF